MLGKRINFFNKILISFFSMVIPLLVYIIVINSNFLRIEQNKMRDSIVVTNSEMILNFENLLRDIDNISQSIQRSTLFRKYNNDNEDTNTITKMSMINELGNYIRANDLISEILVYIKDDNTLYSSSSTYDVDTFVPHIYTYSNWSKSQFINDINSLRQPAWKEFEYIIGKGNYATILYPIPSQSSKPYATILFFINMSNFERNIIKLNFPGTVVQVISNNNKLIYCSNNYLYFNYNKVLSREKISDSGFLSVTSDYTGNKFYSSYLTSKKNSFKFITYVPESILISNIDKAWKQFYINTFALVLITIIGVVIISYLNYKPIKKLRKVVNSIQPSDITDKNEFDSIINILINLNNRSIYLNERLNQAYGALKCQFINDILYGKYNDVNSLNKDGKDFGICFTKQKYCVCAMYLGNSSDYLGNSEIISIMEKTKRKWIPEGYEAFTKDISDNSFIVYILGFDTSDLKRVEDDLKQLRDSIHNILQSDVSFGVGSICDGIKGISASYTQSYVLLKRRFFLGKNSIATSEQLQRSITSMVDYTKEEISLFEESLMLKDPDKILNSFYNIMEKLKSGIPAEIAMCAAYDIIITIMKSNIKIISTQNSKNINSLNSFDLESFSTIEDIENIIKNLASEILKHQLNKSEKHPHFNLQKILDYIEQNYCDYSFSIQKMCKDFNISPSNMTYLFKKSIDCTIVEYIHNKRIEKAKELLLKTDMSIKNIVRSIGYSDTSTFIKRFKYKFSMTPGEYKKLNDKLNVNIR